MRPGGRTGFAGLAAIAVSAGCTVAVAFAGPSIMEPVLPGRPGQPPWTLSLHLSPYAAVGLAGAGILVGAAGLALVLRAMRSGWTISPRALLLAGVVAALLVSQGGPFGSSDFLSYAAYGRELVTGHNPYVVAPEALARLGDPVARAVQDWSGMPSVYGALANGVFGAASLIGGTSARLTVWVLDGVNALSFIGTGLLLDLIARRRAPALRLRTALLWTGNPVLLQVLVAGAHVDTLAVFFAVAGLAVLAASSGPAGSGWPRPLAAGALIALGFAVKPTVALVALGVILAVRPRVSLPVLVGFGGVAAADAGLMGRAGIADASRASGMVSVGSPWRAVRTVLSLGMPEPAADDVVRVCAVVCAVLLAVVLLRRLTGGAGAGAREAFVCVVAWLFCWPYVLPWYDALGWALLVMVPASRADWVLLARTAILGVAYLPARSADITIPGGLRWMEPVLRTAVCPAVLVILVVVLICPARLTADNST